MDLIKRNKERSFFAILTFILSGLVYLSTVAPTVSFWDCGEFIATAYTLGVPHPPGSPLFLLIGRFFSMLPIGTDIAYRVNLISVLTSALAVMLLFLITVLFTKKWITPNTKMNKLALYGGAFIGAMTFAFTDSHWFNAVEAEVYSFSTFLTALVVWLVLVWEEKSDKPGHERYILLIAYIIGLALGIHLLNLLAVFFIALIVYFKKFKVTSLWWLFSDVIIGVAIVGIIFLIMLQIQVSFMWQALVTLGLFVGGYVYFYKKTENQRLSEHFRNVLMAVGASAVFLVINNGVIRGFPKIADLWGIWAVGLTIIILFGATALMIKSKHRIIALALMSLILIVVGYSSYTTIFIRSNQNPIIDENDPETTERAVAYLEREQYGRRSFTDIFDRKVWKPEADNKWKGKGGWNYFIKYQVNKMYIRYFNWQFIGRGPSTAKHVLPYGANSNEDGVNFFQFGLPLPFIIGFFGLLAHFKRDEKNALSVLSLFLFTGIMIVLYLNQDDPQPRERDYSYVGSFFTFSIWIGIGVSELLRIVSKFKRIKANNTLSYITAVVLFLALPVNLLFANYSSHSRKGNFVAWDYSYNILQTCEKDGIIFTNGDNDTFPLWYLQEVEGIRKDVRIVNLSLLNTHWYIRQLRDNEPKIKIGNLSDADIDKLSVMRWEEKTVKLSPPPGSDSKPIEWKLKPTIMGQGIRVQDLMIWQIIEQNRWEKPIYFAVTVSPGNKIGLDKYLQMDGLAFSLKPYKVKKRINVEKMKHNILDVYQYRNLNNPDVHFNRNVRKLVGNYRSGFFQLAIDYLYAGKQSEMLDILDSMAVRMPESVLPIRSEDIDLQLGMLYNEGRKAAGPKQIGEGKEVESHKEIDAPGLEERLERLLNRKNVPLNKKLKYASVYSRELGDNQRAIEILEPIIRSYPKNVEVVSLLVNCYRELEKYSDAVSLLDGWLQSFPNDKQAALMRDQFKQKLEEVSIDTSK